MRLQVLEYTENKSYTLPGYRTHKVSNVITPTQHHIYNEHNSNTNQFLLPTSPFIVPGPPSISEIKLQ